MRKGRLEKQKHNDGTIYWERDTFIPNHLRDCPNLCCNHIKTIGYTNAHDKITFVGLVETSTTHYLKIKFGFETIEEAFQWADNHVDYKHNRFKTDYIEMLTRK
jgi:hypothetical protein